MTLTPIPVSSHHIVPPELIWISSRRTTDEQPIADASPEVNAARIECRHCVFIMIMRPVCRHSTLRLDLLEVLSAMCGIVGLWPG